MWPCRIIWPNEQRGFVGLLDRVAGKRDQGISVGQAMVLMAIHRNSNPGSKVSFLEWYPTTALPELSGLPAELVSYSDLRSSMDYWSDEAIGQVETELTLQVGQRFHLRLHTLAWDSSSCYFEGQTNEVVQFGYSRDHRPDCPQIGTDLFVDVDHGFVPYGRSYEGNETDVERFPQALMDLRSQYPDEEEVTILLDRGPASEENLVLLRELGYGLIAGMPLKGQWAHVFICHLALLLRNLLNLLLQLQEIDLTPQKALKTVKRVRITEVYFPRTGQLFWILNQIDPEVQHIFDAVGLNPQHLLESTGLSPPVTSND